LARNRIWKTNPKFNPPEAETFSFGLSETEFPKEKPKTLIPPLFTIRSDIFGQSDGRTFPAGVKVAPRLIGLKPRRLNGQQTPTAK